MNDWSLSWCQFFPFFFQMNTTEYMVAVFPPCHPQEYQVLCMNLTVNTHEAR
jgi:hypothetical protein